MKLTIKQNNQITERVPPQLIDRLYNLSRTEGELTQDSHLQGSIKTAIAYKDAIDYLNAKWESDGLIVSADDYYIRFADPNVSSVLLNAGFGDGVGITTSEAATANITATFVNNTDIVSFDEFKYFTAQQGRGTLFHDCTSLERIDISDCANIVGGMFSNCSSLSYFHGVNSVQGALIIPNGISSIEGNAFRSCLGITALTLHGNMTIGANAFYDCSNLNAIYIDSLDDWLSITFTYQPLKIAHNLYINGSLVDSVTIPSGTDLTQKFYGSTSLESVTIEDGVTSIGANAFDGGTALTSISIPSGVTSIGDYAFRDCGNLSISNLSLPNLTSIGSQAFLRCGKIEQASDLGSITAIPTYCFAYCTTLTSVTLPNTVTSIGDTAFISCTAFNTINIPSGVTSIGISAFSRCTNLEITDLSLPTLASLGDSAFSGTKVQTISNLGSVTSIPEYCFKNCSQLTSIAIPSSVTSIGADAFRDSTSLISVTILATTPPTLGSGVFKDNATGRKIYVPSESVNAYKAASGWSTYAADIEAIPTT